MSVFVRVLRIVRANLNSAFAAGPSYGGNFAGTQRTRAGPRASGTTQTGPVYPDVDPVLAGYYANLEVPYGSDLATVRRAWKKLVRKYHPDLYGVDPEKQKVANALVQGLNHAYEELAKHLQK